MVDGTSRWEYLLIVSPGDVLPSGAVLRLEGSATAGLEQHARLPVRVTGMVGRQERGSFFVTLESYEPVYPGLSVQAYVGKQSLETLDGAGVIVQPVWVFSGQTADGRLFEVIVQALPDEYLPKIFYR